MAEAIRGVVFNQGKVTSPEGAMLNKYLVGIILVTDQEIFPDIQEIVVTRASSLDIVGQSLRLLNLSTTNQTLGELTNALFTVSEIDLNSLEPIEE
jgi:hypothetical protein